MWYAPHISITQERARWGFPIRGIYVLRDVLLSGGFEESKTETLPRLIFLTSISELHIITSKSQFFCCSSHDVLDSAERTVALYLSTTSFPFGSLTFLSISAMLISEAGVPADSVSFCETWSPGVIPASFVVGVTVTFCACVRQKFSLKFSL